MIPFQFPHSILFTLIPVIGVLTSFSDIRERKIKNSHLLITSLGALILYTITFATIKTAWLLQLLNAVTGIIIGTSFLINKSWRPGDAKLFIVYALIMPPTGQEHLFLLPCIPLFINTFLLGLCFFTPPLLLTAFRQHKNLIKNFLAIEKPRQKLNAFMATISLSWIIPAVYSSINVPIPLIHHPLIRYLLCFTIWNMAPRLEPYSAFTRAGLLVCLCLGIYVSPESFAIFRIFYLLLMILAYALFFQLLNGIIRSINDPQDRVPFAPFLFLGCLLSYTPFLGWLLKIFHR